MIVQAIDGRFYLYPRWSGPAGVLSSADGKLTLFRPGRIVTWGTLVGVATSLGVKLRPVASEQPYAENQIIEDKLVRCCGMTVALRMPPPVPTHSDGSIVSVPAEDKTVIRWTPRQLQRGGHG